MTTRNDIERVLWKACDSFRGKIDSSRYKDYILSMLFVKYFRENPNTTHHQCAQALRIPEKVVLDVIAELYKDRLLDLHALPLGNDLDPGSSSFYSACREYHD